MIDTRYYSLHANVNVNVNVWYVDVDGLILQPYYHDRKNLFWYMFVPYVNVNHIKPWRKTIALFGT